MEKLLRAARGIMFGQENERVILRVFRKEARSELGTIARREWEL